MNDPRSAPSQLLYWLSRDYRTSLNRIWQERHGTPPPWTATGKRFQKALADRANLVQNPRPIHGGALYMRTDDLNEIERRFHAELVGMVGPGHPFFTLGNGIEVDTKEAAASVASFAPGHLLTIAATRAGKGTSHIVPNLLMYAGSTLVIDPKGENYALTHARRRAFGRVVRIDPFRVTAEVDPVSPFAGHNPMEFVGDEGDARRLASVLLGDAAKGDGQFWHDEALNLLSAVIFACVLMDRDQLSDVWDVLSASNSDRSNGPSDLMKGLTALADLTEEPGPKRRIESFIGYEVKMQSSILASINAKMSIWDTPEIAKAVSQTDVPFGDLKRDVVTVYVVLPFDKMGDYGAFLRLMIGQFYQEMIKGGKAEGIPVACLIDEFPALGSMKELVRALAEIAGYGVRFWLFVQNISQLKSLYPDDWNVILSQCSTVNVFGVTDAETVDWLATTLGQKTTAIDVRSVNLGGNGRDEAGSFLVNSGTNHGVQLIGAPLITPEEIMELFGVGQPFQVILLSGKRPIAALRKEYHTDKNLSKMAGSTEPEPLALPNDLTGM